MDGKDRIFATPMERAQDFVFNQGVADVFDDMVERSVPFYSEIQRMLVEMASHFAQSSTEVVDLGCSTGTTLALLTERVIDPSISLVGVDNSRPMLDTTRQRLMKLGVDSRCVLIEADFNEAFSLNRPSVVVMNWTLQFVRPIYRNALLHHIYESLQDQGCFLLCEKILGEDSLLNRLYIDLYHDFKRRQGYSDLEIAQKREALENVLIPYRVAEYLYLLRNAGFEIVDVFFRWYNWAGFIGIKRKV